MKLYNDLAEYYYSIEENHRDINKDVSLIVSVLRGKKTPKLLDLGCGSGEHLAKLSKYDIQCTGIDASEAMLEVARSRFPDKISFIHKDMTDFDYYNEFDIIISLFGSFNYMIDNEDVDKVLWNTWRALKQGGIGIFEIWNTVPVEVIREKQIGPVSTTHHDEVTIERERGFRLLPNPNKTIVEVNYRYTVQGNKGMKTMTDRHLMRTFTTEEFSGYLKENGFFVKDVFSNSSKEVYQDFSNRIVVIFEKS